ncbi:RIP metalloprotease RseP [Bacillus taeanensis]|uniref:Zinc metalloprotease n=1 Tax=Bacillus taeanensis TaxID=273032 RepID=A0A366XWF1_9BACI|nr:RIP metalloprotease RseP [Bacillus taeanensis]RBW69878.1 RIP metalloprotease RseP [Bacillus taeanensis]
MNSIIAIIVIFGALVFFHELGHLLLAKRAGILCREFAIGFGPKIFSMKKGETVYTIRLLPLGGFVRMAGEDPENIDLKPGHRIGLLLNPDNKVKKIVVNRKINYPDAKIITVEAADLEHKLVIKGYESEEGPLEVYDVSKKCHYVMDGQEYQIAPYDRQFGSKSLWDRFLAIFAGPFMNFLLAFVILAAFGLMYGSPVNQAIIGGVAENGAAAEAGLQTGDKIINIDGQSINSWDEFTEVIQQHPSQEITFTVERNDKTLELPITPQERPNYKGETEGVIGVGYQTEFSILGSIKYGFDTTIEYTKLIVFGLGQLVTGAISIDNLSGPVGIYSYTDQAAKEGLAVLLRWGALLSINLGIINLLPLPALDGGRLIFIAIEGLRGKPIDPQKESLVHFIGFAFLMLLMLVVTWNDIQKFFLN